MKNSIFFTNKQKYRKQHIIKKKHLMFMKLFKFIKKISNPLISCDSNYISFKPEIKIDNHDINKPNILIICTFPGSGGIEMHSFSLHRYLIKKGYNSLIIIPNNSYFKTKLLEEHLPFYTYKQSRFFKPNRQPGLRRVISNIIKKYNINIVHCNRAKDTHLLRGIPKNVKRILTRHAPSMIRNKYTNLFDAIIGVNKNFIKKVTKKFPKKEITHITPFFSEHESLNFTTNISKKDFFQKEFNIELDNHPTIVQLGGLSNIKNHKVLFQALHILINKKQKPVNMLLCGDGYNKKMLQKLANKLNIKKYIHFLGFTNKRIEVIFHSDIKTLTSKSEGHSICLMEAALLKKPLIGPTYTGVVNIIKHEKTGLLFKNNNAQDLAKQIEKLLDNPELQKKYGENAYEYVKNNFIADILIKKIEDLHTKVLKNRN